MGFISLLTFIGAVWLAINATQWVWTLIKMLLPRKDLQQEYGPNTWAVITGGSDGIGLAFAR